jgi:sodium pump decarboxylase gamma subunit
MNSLLSISPEQYSEKLSFSEALSFGGQMVLLGMGVVFSVLAIIWLVLTIFKSIFNNVDNKSSQAAPAVESVPVPAVPSATADAEIVAVIAAAIAMAESENNGLSFRVVSFRRK